MNIGDKVSVPDGRAGILVRLENGVATVLFDYGNNQTVKSSFNQSDVTPAAH